MKIEVALTEAELAAIKWLADRPNTYRFEELKLRRRLAERFLERVLKAAAPARDPSQGLVRVFARKSS